jgi:hypothetical protein
MPVSDVRNIEERVRLAANKQNRRDYCKGRIGAKHHWEWWPKVVYDTERSPFLKYNMPPNCRFKSYFVRKCAGCGRTVGLREQHSIFAPTQESLT